MAIVKCIVPLCKVVGEGVPGRPYACVRHTKWIVTGVRGLRAVAKAAVVEVGKQVRREVRPPWWADAFYEGVRNRGD